MYLSLPAGPQDWVLQEVLSVDAPGDDFMKPFRPKFTDKT
jgi:hypothetical protein